MMPSDPYEWITPGMAVVDLTVDREAVDQQPWDVAPTTAS